MSGPILQNPLFQAVLTPFALALILIALIRLAGGARWGGRAAGVALAIGLLVGYVLLEGWPPFPPPAAKQKAFYLIALCGLLGLALDLGRLPVVILRVAAVAFPALCLGWIAWRRLAAGPDGAFVLQLGLLWLGSAAVLWGLADDGRRHGPLAVCVLVIVTAAAAAAIAMLGASISLALLAAAVAAAAGGCAIWIYGERLFGREAEASAALVLGGGGALAALAPVMSLYTPQISQPALAVLVLVPFSGLLAGRIPLRGDRLERIASPIILAIVAALPALAAVGVAYLAGGE